MSVVACVDGARCTCNPSCRLSGWQNSSWIVCDTLSSVFYRLAQTGVGWVCCMHSLLAILGGQKCCAPLLHSLHTRHSVCYCSLECASDGPSVVRLGVKSVKSPISRSHVSSSGLLGERLELTPAVHRPTPCFLFFWVFPHPAWTSRPESRAIKQIRRCQLVAVVVMSVVTAAVIILFWDGE